MTQNDSEGEPSKRKDTSSSIPTQIEQALDDALINYNVGLTKLEQGDDIFKALTHGISALKPAILQDLAQKLAIKIYASLELNFHLSVDPSFITELALVLNTVPVLVLESTDIARVLEGIF